MSVRDGWRGNDGRRKADSEELICWLLPLPSRGVKGPHSQAVLPQPLGKIHLTSECGAAMRSQSLRGSGWMELRPRRGHGSLHNGQDREVLEPNPHPGRLRHPAVLGNEEKAPAAETCH